ncbi:MAG: molybdopterin-dependent oxidoreductase, partial [Candidatus Binatia bacterium]
MPHTQHTFCRICEALCGLEVSVDGGRVVEIRPDAAHVATEGFACVKGLKQHRLFDSKDRLKHPIKRSRDGYARVSWDDALAEIGHRVRRVVAQYGPDSVATYVGTAAGFGVLHPMFARGFMEGIGSKSMYSTATQDCSNKFAVATHMYGFPFTQTFPDLDNVECLIVVGANPVVSKWSFLQVPFPARRLKSIVKRGGRLFIVDPRKTESAKVAGEHVFIRPGTDVFFYLSFLDRLVAVGGVDHPRVARYMSGYEEVARLARDWPAERTAEVTRVPAAKLHEMVGAYLAADGAALYCSTGVNMGGDGLLAYWLQECINAVSGNLDRAGGTLVGRGLVDLARFGRRTGALLRTDRSRIGDFVSVNDTFPAGLLADEILTPGKGQVRALFVTGGNPLITMANSQRLLDAFGQLDLLVTVDIFQSETGSVADFVLPATSPLQRPDLPFVFPLMMGMQVKPYLQATERVVEPDQEQRDEATIFLDLARACGVKIFGSSVAHAMLEFSRWLHGVRRPERRPELPQEFLLSLLLRFAGKGGLGRLLRQANGVLEPPHESGRFLGKRVVTWNRKVQLAPPLFVEQANKLEAGFGREMENSGRLKLITRRAVSSHNSWMHNLEDFVDGRRTNHLYMHPDDANAAGLAEGELADVSTDTGKVRVPVKILSDLMPGTV